MRFQICIAAPALHYLLQKLRKWYTNLFVTNSVKTLLSTYKNTYIEYAAFCFLFKDNCAGLFDLQTISKYRSMSLDSAVLAKRRNAKNCKVIY